MEDAFKDPENLNDYVKKIQECPTLEQIYNLIKETYPSWIITFLKQYSNDYYHIQANWEKACKDHNLKHRLILLVKDYPNDESHTLVNLFAELYTRCGFMVRRESELQPCNVCDCAIPNKELWEKMIEAKLNVPKVWSSKCENC